jgi:hypothetical protein
MWKPLNCSGSSVVVASKFLRARAYSWPKASSPNMVRAPAAMASRVHMASQSLSRPWATDDVPERPVSRTFFGRSSVVFGAPAARTVPGQFIKVTAATMVINGSCGKQRHRDQWRSRRGVDAGSPKRSAPFAGVTALACSLSGEHRPRGSSPPNELSLRLRVVTKAFHPTSRSRVQRARHSRLSTVRRGNLSCQLSVGKPVPGWT